MVAGTSGLRLRSVNCVQDVALMVMRAPYRSPTGRTLSATRESGLRDTTRMVAADVSDHSPPRVIDVWCVSFAGRSGGRVKNERTFELHTFRLAGRKHEKKGVPNWEETWL